MATQANSTETPEFAYFFDFVRDSLRGSHSNVSLIGYVAGGGGYTSAVRICFNGDAAGTVVLATAEGTVAVDAISACALVKEAPAVVVLKKRKE